MASPTTVQNLSDLELSSFHLALQVLAEEDLIDEMINSLKDKGITSINISYAVIEAAKSVVKEKKESGQLQFVGSGNADKIINCGCCNFCELDV